MRYILTDIEGTTTSVAFVYETLFPYFKKHIADFLEAYALQPGIAAYLQEVQHTVLQEGGHTLSMEALAEQLIAWTDSDRKHPALKAIQGALWGTAYNRGTLKGHVYADVPPALERWRQAGIGMGVYSSGSVEAQQLLFSHSVYGDLSPYFSHHFDTLTGPKREVQSYRLIAEALLLPPADILFLSDVEAELDAAAAAGMQTTQLVRPGIEAGQKHRLATDFSEISEP